MISYTRKINIINLKGNSLNVIHRNDFLEHTCLQNFQSFDRVNAYKITAVIRNLGSVNQP